MRVPALSLMRVFRCRRGIDFPCACVCNCFKGDPTESPRPSIQLAELTSLGALAFTRNGCYRACKFKTKNEFELLQLRFTESFRDPYAATKQDYLGCVFFSRGLGLGGSTSSIACIMPRSCRISRALLYLVVRYTPPTPTSAAHEWYE